MCNSRDNDMKDIFEINSIKSPFAKNGEKSTISDTGEGLSFEKGFGSSYSDTDTPKPVKASDINAIANQGTQLQYFKQMGGLFTFNQDVSDKIGGYPKGAVLYIIFNKTYRAVMSLIENNTYNFVDNPLYIDNEKWRFVNVDFININQIFKDETIIESTDKIPSTWGYTTGTGTTKEPTFSPFYKKLKMPYFPESRLYSKPDYDVSGKYSYSFIYNIEEDCIFYYLIEFNWIVGTWTTATNIHQGVYNTQKFMTRINLYARNSDNDKWVLVNYCLGKYSKNDDGTINHSDTKESEYGLLQNCCIAPKGSQFKIECIGWADVDGSTSRHWDTVNKSWYFSFPYIVFSPFCTKIDTSILKTNN